ncbi:MAG: TlpA disulfide reductase family protein [candidate division WOR-3 bacterium]
MTKTLFRIFLFLSILSILIIFFISILQTNKMKDSKLIRKAVNFKLPKIDNLKDSLSLSDFKGKIIILNFWASWCEPCKEEANELNKIYTNFKDSVILIGINIWDRRENALEFIKNYNLKFLNLYSKDNPISVDYGITGVPETIIIDKEGNIIYHFKGPINEKIINEIIKNMR